jgi:hypothetical protein
LIAKILRGIDDQPKRIWLAIRFAQELKKNKGFNSALFLKACVALPQT